MDAIGRAILAAAALLGAAQSEPATEWREFRSEEGNFLLWIPAKPEELKVDGCPPGARVWQASGDALLTLFQFGFIGKQKDLAGAEADAFLEGLARESAESLSGTVVGSKKVTLSRWPGRETRVTFKAGDVDMVLMDRVYIVDRVKLFVRVMVPADRADRAEHRKILDSFKLIDEGRVARD